MIESLGLFWSNVSAIVVIVVIFAGTWWLAKWGARKRREDWEKWEASHPPQITHEQLQALIELANERIERIGEGGK